MTATRRAMLRATLAGALLLLGCARDAIAQGAPRAEVSPQPAGLGSTPLARDCVDAMARLGGGPASSDPGKAPAYRVEGGSIRVALPRPASKGVLRPASVTLPLAANDAVHLTDDSTRMALSVRLRGASSARPSRARDYVVYPGALPGADWIHRVHADGAEDYVYYATRPTREAISYEVDLARVAGLRVVSNTVEFLDARGAPRLRVAPPSVQTEDGVHEAAVTVEGCAFDADPRPPEGRPVVPPGASRCVVRVAWAASSYPALVDPSWTATGSMATPRYQHTAAPLPGGLVLVAGGVSSLPVQGMPVNSLASAEVYDPVSGTFAATASMGSARYGHTATALAAGEVLVAGGDASTPSTAELYDVARGTFVPTAGSMVKRRYQHSATGVAAGQVLLAGGDTDATLVPKGRTAELYDPATGTFALTAGNMVTALAQHSATLLPSGEVLVAGGFSELKILGMTFLIVQPTAELYDPVLGTFSAAVGGMTIGRAMHTATLLPSGDVLVAGGYFGGGVSLYAGTATAELYDPVGGLFRPTSNDMTVEREQQTASVLASGQILVAGGSADGVGGISQADLYDPTTGLFAPSPGAMVAARLGSTATVLSSGQVLLTGGASELATIASAELYDLSSAGGPCTVDANCKSNVCDDGTCCAAYLPCGVCETCAPGSGACVPVVSAPDPDTCDGTKACSASSECKLADGQAAPSAAACASGFLSDGVCCDSACDAPCDVCASARVEDGRCGPAAAGYGGDPACGDGFACDGESAACPSHPCEGDTDCLPTDYCSASGACAPGRGDLAACDTAAGADCRVAGCRVCLAEFCVNGACCPHEGSQCLFGASCTSDGLGVVPPGASIGAAASCAPYVCRSGACATRCASVADCAAPSVCDDDGKCVPPPTNGNGAGGCSLALPGGPAEDRGWPGRAAGLVLVALGFAARARARAVGTRGRRGS